MARTIAQIRADNDRATHRATMIEILSELGSITIADLADSGWDISVARRALRELAEDNKVSTGKDPDGTITYKLNGRPLYLTRWVSSTPQEDNSPRYC